LEYIVTVRVSITTGIIYKSKMLWNALMDEVNFCMFVLGVWKK